jgi:hypothetical protein
MTKPDFKALSAPTPKEEAKVRKGPGGTQLTYVDARFVMDRLDSAVGPENWYDSYAPVDGGIEATIYIRVGDDFIGKSDVGTESTIEKTKGNYSDAFKRAAVKWGIGRDLYDEKSDVRQPAPKPAPKPKVADKVEAEVVGQSGLTQSQRGLLFARLKEAGITGDQRKAFAWLAINKHSVKDMTSEDLDKAIAILDAPKSENPQVWENIELISGE